MENMTITIALAGNPNSGKTTLFNQFTGNHQYVGNWPGVTVEKKEGVLKGDKDVHSSTCRASTRCLPTPKRKLSRVSIWLREP